ncbi:MULTISPECIES: class II fumarate hydratase [Thermus]|uniref:Fumarate hydratase class II n=4 Tax=Thermus thermophilus TaxID=274 RepID=FUMC_THET2|nr:MULTISPECIES: class II fumarate hydratase [Thermus]O66271.2 RecName: Full=Fumarate hydratase class II; Short=Fumarase C; AltName: Full=Aerobic fumarase; AltName: Full=Iron-independent fumarase [Thermus thermophilus HB27]AAS80538.1 fumarate hydratase [Thermus thermophilus HB27]QMV30249.1 class II fumarate hydratase [Thermus thermophilus]QZY59063.1 class II fumarate hydratase [Thermus thermophilus]WMV95594.1 class II fumarate hydratase [Thermus thermophilus HB27]BAD70381.1 fumarate hydratase
MEYRIERDTMGEVRVPADKYWGAQTQRSLENFRIGTDRFRMPLEIIRAYGMLKKAAARANLELGELPEEIAKAIIQAAEEVVQGKWDDHFPLVVFQTGSGTQTNMNVNEVIANRASEILGKPLGSKYVHPNDHVNRGQSSNDTFPTAMYVAVALALHQRLYPAVEGLIRTFTAKAQAFDQIVKVGRTHLMDAVPITLGQEIGSWAAQLKTTLAAVKEMEKGLYNLAIGGTAVGTGLNAHPRFGELVAKYLAEETGLPFRVAENRFAALAAHDELVNVMGAIRTLAGALMKIGNDVRWLASGPYAGIGEITIPANEPGSSIMPGKVNPTQVEALTMVVVRVYGNDHTVAFAGSQGNFQLNVYKPVMAYSTLESINLLADAVASFDAHLAQGIEPNLERIEEHLQKNPMLATALNKAIGYDKAAEIVKKALKEKKTLKQAALELGYLTEEEFDRIVVPMRLAKPHEGA